MQRQYRYTLIKSRTERRDEDESQSSSHKKRCIRFSPQFQVYVSYFLSSWGDRMWTFAGGLFLIEITPGSLRLIAIYEAALSLTVIFLGAAVGRMVDKVPRLKAAQTCLIIQNMMVCLCTFLLCVMTSYGSYFKEALNGWGEIAMQTGTVALACIAQIGSLGSKLAIEKDWIVIISEGNNVQLSTMNSVLRSVDLSTAILAPILVGLVMGSAGMVVGGIVIGSWNACSVIIEYGLLHTIYWNVPALQKPKDFNDNANGSHSNFLKKVNEKIKDSAATWKLYFAHEIRNAGLGLAFLYMTVLALDNYTRAYMHDSGVGKSILGGLTAVASIFGILGSVAFPFLRKKLGVLRTGIFGFSIESLCLIFCVVSVFAPGTLFEPRSLFISISEPPIFSTTSTTSKPIFFVGDAPGTKTVQNALDSSLLNPNDSHVLIYSTEEVSEPFSIEVNHHDDHENLIEPTSYISVILLLTGIITSRFGLWLADLTVTQILQEDVTESLRGGINGVQYSLNQSLSLLRSLLLIAFPTLGTFGYLIILSFLFVITATVLFCVYASKKKKQENFENIQQKDPTDLL